MKQALKNLELPTKKWINRLKKEYDFEEHHLRLLILCGEAWDRSQEARAILDKEGCFLNHLEHLSLGTRRENNLSHYQHFVDCFSYYPYC